MTNKIQTPCVQICELNSQGLCTGCYRTRDEIGRWSIITPEEREEVMQKLPQREELYLNQCFD